MELRNNSFASRDNFMQKYIFRRDIMPQPRMIVYWASFATSLNPIQNLSSTVLCRHPKTYTAHYSSIIGLPKSIFNDYMGKTDSQISNKMDSSCYKAF